jgi:protein-disulfide isomerase
VRVPAIFGAAALVAAAALAPHAGAAPARPRAAAPVDWTKRVAATPQGGFVMGNPAAKVKVVEYGSLTCGHCAAFSAAAFDAKAGAPLLAHVRSGKVSYEFRNFVLNGTDVAASLVARCTGPAGFFKFADRAYATQRQWMDRIGNLSAAQKAQLNGLSKSQTLVRLGEIGGLVQMGTQMGLPAARAKACLADPAALDRLGKMYEAAEALGVEGTPTFFLNGRNIGTHDWASLQPLIRQAGG